MRLTTKGRFAVTAMLDLAINETKDAPDTKPVTLAGISERQDISLSYLEQLFSRLRRQGLVKSIRGPGGGYNLAKNYSEISVAEIINAVDEQIDATQCGGHENCRDEGRCMTHDLWSALNTKILEYLDGVTLADMVASQKNGQKVLFTPRNCSGTHDKATAINSANAVAN
ncbi:MAG: Fe-S cluster assembly transcriptional regulator IscR [Methylotenera sp.]|uniref:Fe-S cluster assembly transcriptional regulator IscR n=1 Tax=Methylotenera sp. TaxID=2051956 RepID=UPI000D4F2863|nr:Fe-S cluster assembly transcriptional regulator IscR [Methylotenera sp.]PPC80049.1 MAG: Fe-S cluster assembly transcriptional regulator IscR [Methylotenera sp.]